MSKSPIKRGSRGTFAPGSSGNPGGRPRTPVEVKELLSSVTGEAVERLVSIMRSKDPQQARLAAEALLDRSLGRPQQSVDLTARKALPGPEAFEALAAGAVSVLEQALKEADEADAAKAAQLSGITEDGEPESNLESGSLDDASPTENDTGDEPQRALSARFTDDGGD